MSANDQPWTIGRLLNWTTDFLKEKGAESPRLDAEVLLAHVRGCKRIELYTSFEQPASDELRAKFRELVKERAAGKPVAYLVGHREFFSLPFTVTPDVLIPRPETELLIVRALDIAKPQPRVNDPPERDSNDVAPNPPAPNPPAPKPTPPPAKPIAVADVGTGSGIIAVTLAKHLPSATLTMIDVSPAALAVAQKNAERNGVSDRITAVESDLFAALPAEQKFDLIASNPPYITSAEMQELAVDVRRYEPTLALDGGPEGTTVIERLIGQAAERLRPGGWLLMEISPTIVERVEQLLEADSRLQREPTQKDIAGLARVVQARRKGE
ncbi:peptide chain release factor N(5)-glutamine methyltransferase [Lacipirellula parvula]|uniref:Release factor glutamine methyltransferase n=1 Tax=Lacipirellula parvula TaxID=2650471 RepID=A0A5K7XET5_9BACT|nr:peptide chain release factor N(5)-glutamine methyltransferase [Lacipirellula parvula]BBO34512.1 methyltransferase [Lacipirellula parvula]